jgi:hypothetical protein
LDGFLYSTILDFDDDDIVVYYTILFILYL